MRSLFLIVLIAAPLLSKAQTEIPATIPSTPIYPEIRPVISQFEQLFFRKFQYKYNGRTVSGKIEEESRFTTMVTAPLLVRKKIILATSLHYIHENLEMQEVDYTTSDSPYLNPSKEFSAGSFSFSFGSVYKDSLFRRPVTLISNIYFDSHNMEKINRVRGILIGTINLKKTDKTKLSIGLAYAYNSTSSLPMSPVVRYWHKFNYSQWQIDAMLPKSIYLRRPSKNLAWFGIGAEATNNTFYSTCTNALLPRENLNSITEVRGALSYEYPLHKWVMLGVKTGVSRLMSLKVIDAKSAPTDYYIKGTGGFSPFLNLNISLTPCFNFSSTK
jgi:hypothetical protein